MAESLLELDPERELVEAFATFDAEDVGVIDGPELRRLLKSEGDRLTDAEVRRLLRSQHTRQCLSQLIALKIDGLLSAPFVDKRGRFCYNDCASQKHNMTLLTRCSRQGAISSRFFLLILPETLRITDREQAARHEQPA